MRKPKYEVGDYVRVRSDLSLNWSEGITPEIIDFAGKLVQISSIDTDDLDWDDLAYEVKELKGYYWSEDWFEYRLGNYEDNATHETIYRVGFDVSGRNQVFKGKLQKWSTEKCEFVNKNGIILMVDYNNINYVVPIDDEV